MGWDGRLLNVECTWAEWSYAGNGTGTGAEALIATSKKYNSVINPSPHSRNENDKFSY